MTLTVILCTVALAALILYAWYCLNRRINDEFWRVTQHTIREGQALDARLRALEKVPHGQHDDNDSP